MNTKEGAELYHKKSCRALQAAQAAASAVLAEQPHVRLQLVLPLAEHCVPIAPGCAESFAAIHKTDEALTDS
jgi:hypothetical protein